MKVVTKVLLITNIGKKERKRNKKNISRVLLMDFMDWHFGG